MKKIGLILIGLMITANVYAVEIIVKLTDEEYKAMSVLNVTAEEWIQHAAENKARKMIDSLVDERSDKKINKMTKQEKIDILNSIDLKKEKEKRHGKEK